MKHVSMLNRIVVLALVLAGAMLVTGQALAQTPAAPATPAASPCTGSTLCGSFPTTLVKALDSKKLKEGDVVLVQTAAPIRTHGMLIPTGSKITGHITQSQAKSKGDSQSSLAMMFDKIEVTKGHELPMKATLLSIAPSLGSSGPDTATMMGSPQMIAGQGDTSTMPSGTTPGVAGVNSGIHPLDAGSGAHPIVNRESVGVLGFKNMEMSKDGVITSSGKEVKLDNGTQMMIKAEIQIPTS
jgi:hypothetical protein